MYLLRVNGAFYRILASTVLEMQFDANQIKLVMSNVLPSM